MTVRARGQGRLDARAGGRVPDRLTGPPDEPRPPGPAAEPVASGPACGVRADGAGSGGAGVLGAHLVVERDDFALDLALSVSSGEVVAMLGPNGAGKTTALRALAGLVPLRRGHIELAGRRVDEPGTGLFVPPERRSIGMVFQDYLLFPHLSVIDNVAFGLRCRDVPRREARARAAGWLDGVGLGGYAHRRPRELSGGQAQRVALARALASGPALLLLDEPLAALDVRARLDTRAELRRQLAGHVGGTLLVTHDPLDALVLADRLLVIEHGRLVQAGEPEAVLARPRTEYVARLVGLNLCRGRANGHSVVLADGCTVAVVDALYGEVSVAFPPSAVSLHPQRPSGGARNGWSATVDGVERHGDYLRVRLAGAFPAAADVPTVIAAGLGLHGGMRVWVSVDHAQLRAYPAS